MAANAAVEAQLPGNEQTEDGRVSKQRPPWNWVIAGVSAGFGLGAGIGVVEVDQDNH